MFSSQTDIGGQFSTHTFLTGLDSWLSCRLGGRKIRFGDRHGLNSIKINPTAGVDNCCDSKGNHQMDVMAVLVEKKNPYKSYKHASDSPQVRTTQQVTRTYVAESSSDRSRQYFVRSQYCNWLAAALHFFLLLATSLLQYKNNNRNRQAQDK